MAGPDDTHGLELVGETIKDLFPPRVELAPQQYQQLQKLGEKTGKTVKELVRQAVDRYLNDEDSK